MSVVQIRIQNGDRLYEPAVLEGVTWETERKGAPGRLVFSVLKDAALDFQEGNYTVMAVDGEDVFAGFVFTKKRGKDGIIQVMAYDQLRYLKNKDVYWYTNKTASEVVKNLAHDFALKAGEIEDTKYVIAQRHEDNKTLFDIIQTAIGITAQNTKRLYVLYSDFDKLALKDVENMKLDLLIDEETAVDFAYESSIDKNTYNRVKLYRDNHKDKERELFFAPDDPKEFMGSASIKRWGVLQYCDTVNEKCSGQERADALLDMYNRKTRRLSVSDAFGDIRVRAGSSVLVKLNLGDMKVNHYFLVEKCRHKFTNKLHTMDLTLRGGDFLA